MLHNPAVETFGQRLEWAIKNRGWNYSKLASEISVSRNAVSQWVNDTNGSSPESMAKAARALRVNLRWLEKGEGSADLASIVGSYDPDDDARRGVSSTGKGRHKLTPGAIAEIESRAGMGGGGYAMTTEVNDEGGAQSYAADMVKAEWIMPPAFVRSELGVSFGFTEIVQVHGDSMEPDFRSGDRVIVDRRNRGVRQGGFFAVREGDELLVKQVELVRPETDPPRIRITSRNAAYAPYELALDGSNEVIGRIAGRISRV